MPAGIYVRPSLINLFWEKVDKSATVHPTLGSCWVWTSWKGREGYGRLTVGGKTKYAHRTSWELAHGEIPRGQFVLHRCDNKLCVNPAHLFLGTQADNIRDMTGKNRQAKGEENGNSKLLEVHIREIRRLYRTGKHFQRSLAVKFGVGRGYINAIVNRKVWKHVK